MSNEINDEIIDALKLSAQWKDFKDFCNSRKNCKGCPYEKPHTCSYTSTEKIMTSIARAAKKYLTDNGIPIESEHP